MAITLAILSFLPSSNVFFPVGFVIAERNLYLPALGFQLLLLDAVKRLEKRFGVWPRLGLKIGLSFVLLSFLARSRLRSAEWSSEKSLFQSGLRVCPHNAKVHYNIAKRAADEGDIITAISGYRHALALFPDYAQALNNLGNIYRKQGAHVEAKELLIKAVSIQDDFAAAWMNLGTVHASLRDFDAAEKSYQAALSHRTPYADCWYNLGNLFLKTQRPKEALVAFKESIRQRPTHKKAWLNLILLEDEEGKTDAAVQSAKRAIEIFPGEAEFHSHLAGIYGKQDLFEEAEASYLRSLGLAETSFTLGNLGVLYHRWKKVDKAKLAYEKALLLDPKNLSAKKNLDSLRFK